MSTPERALGDITTPTKQAGTQYLVLEKKQGDAVWKEQGTSVASSARDAVRKHVEGRIATELSSSFVAVPARSWNPVKVSLESKPVVRLEGA